MYQIIIFVNLLHFLTQVYNELDRKENRLSCEETVRRCFYDQIESLVTELIDFFMDEEKLYRQ